MIAHPTFASSDPEILHHQLKQLQARLTQQTLLTDTLKFHNDDLTQQIAHKDHLITTLKSHNQEARIALEDYKNKLAARKKSSEETIMQLRRSVGAVTEKNIRLCEIIEGLQARLEQTNVKLLKVAAENDAFAAKNKELEEEINLGRVKIAKAEVEAEKYKLKTMEGQKFWSLKMEKSKQQQREDIYDSKIEIQKKFKTQIGGLQSEVFRLQKTLKLKDQQLASLEDRIAQLILGGEPAG